MKTLEYDTILRVFYKGKEIVVYDMNSLTNDFKYRMGYCKELGFVSYETCDYGRRILESSLVILWRLNKTLGVGEYDRKGNE